MADPTEAQRKRSEARERRRNQAAPAENRPGHGEGEAAEEALETVKHAAKIAAAGAAVGAAAAAARALSSHSDDQEHKSQPADEAEQAPEAEQESPEAETDTGSDGRSRMAEEAPPADEESPEAEPRPSSDDASAEATAAAEDGREDPVQGASPDEATETVQRARQQLAALLERPVESISGFERTHDGWLVTLEVVEVSRIPESTDVLASYELELDDDRNLRRYARVRRYNRSQADLGDQR
jgi:Gas vesicle synthesis protein GvpO